MHRFVFTFAFCSSLAIACLGRGDGTSSPDQKAIEEATVAIQRFQLPEGIKVELVAAEPLVTNPVAFSLDEQGRFFIAETFRVHSGVSDNRWHMEWLADDLASRTVEDRIRMMQKYLPNEVDDYRSASERVRLVEDFDGDGKADHATVFSDGYNKLEDGIGAGVLARNGDVYFTCIPDLWLLRDLDGDGVADEKKSLQSGYGVRVSFYGHDLHGLIFGPDGKLYFSIGDRGLNVRTPDRHLEAYECGSVLRCNPDGSDLEIVHTGLRNPQELAFDKYGNLFTGDNNSDSGDKARIVYIVEGGDSGWRTPYQYITSPVARGPWNQEKLWHPPHEGQPAYIVPPVDNFADGPSGFVYYPGFGLPEKYNNHFFLVDFRGGSAISGLRSFRVEPMGAGFKLADPEKFIWRMVATDIDFGFDGAMYSLDWVEGWDNPNKGRIYRIFDPAFRGQGLKNAKLVADGIEKLGANRLVGLLSHADMRIRQRAQFALAAQPEEGAEELTRVAASGDNRLARLHGIWGIGQIARKDRDVLASLLSLMDDPDAEVRAQAIKTAGELRYADAYDVFLKHLKDENPRVQFFSAIALGRLGKPEAAPALLELAERNADSDPYIRHAVVVGLVGCHNPAAIEKAMAASEPESVRRAALLVLRREESPEVVAFLKPGNGYDASLAEEAARAVYDLPIPAGFPALAALAAEPSLSDMTRLRAIAANMRLGKEENARRVAEVAGDGRQSEDVRLMALQSLADWSNPSPLDPAIGFHRPMGERTEGVAAKEFARVAPALVAASDRKMQELAIELAGRFQTHGLESQLVEIFRNAKETSGVRAAALESLAKLNVDDLAKLVREGLADKRSTVRKVAQKELASLDPESAVDVYAGVLEQGEVDEKQEAFRTLADMKSNAADQLFVDWLHRLEQGKVAKEVRLDLRLAAAKRSSEAVKNLLAKLDAEQTSVDDPVAKYEDCLSGGNALNGSKIFFENTALACLRCHKIGGKGGEVGPELTKIGGMKDRRYLLESIVDPNRAIAKGFETAQLIMNDGTVRVGIVQQETPDELHLIDAEAKKFTVAKSDIDERQQGKSAMPVDAISKMSLLELRDLIEFLATRN